MAIHFKKILSLIFINFYRVISEQFLVPSLHHDWTVLLEELSHPNHLKHCSIDFKKSIAWLAIAHYLQMEIGQVAKHLPNYFFFNT